MTMTPNRKPTMRYPSASLVALSGLICLHQSIAFAPTSLASVRQPPTHRHANYFVRKAAAKNDDNTDDGMANAFKALDGLSADDFVDEDDPAPRPARESSEEESATASFDGAPEEEIEMYKKMMNELESEGDGGIYDSIRTEMGGGSAGGAPYKSIEEAVEKETSILNDADGIGSGEGENESGSEEKLTVDSALQEARGEPSLDQFMEMAVSEALDEARQQAPDADVPQSIRDDKELMAEINEIFDKATDKLMKEMKEDMKVDQETAQRESMDKADMFKESEQRLADAEESVTRLMGKRNNALADVEKALADLEKERSKLDSNPLSKISDLKEQGIVKQASFVGLLLFSLRTFTELLLMTGPNGGAHAVAAGIQAAIALACGAYFLFF